MNVKNKSKIIGIVIVVVTLCTYVASSIIFFTDPVNKAKTKRMKIDMTNRLQNQFYGLDDEIKNEIGSSTDCIIYDFDLTFDENHYLKNGYMNLLMTLNNKKFIYQFNKNDGETYASVLYYCIDKYDSFNSKFSSHSNQMIFDILAKTVEGHTCDWLYSGIQFNDKIYRADTYLYENQEISKLDKAPINTEYMYLYCFPQESDVVYNKTEYYYFK